MEAQSFRGLLAYKKAFALAMEIFRISKEFPKEERYSLIDFSKSCSYISAEVWKDLERKANEVGRLLNHMIENPKSYQRKPTSK